MPANYRASLKTTRMNDVVTDIGASGKLKFLDASDVVLVTFALAATAGTVSGSVLTFSDANGATAGVLNANATAAGTAAKAVVTKSDDTVVISGLTVGTSGADFIIDNTSIAVGQGVTVNSATITHA